MRSLCPRTGNCSRPPLDDCRSLSISVPLKGPVQGLSLRWRKLRGYVPPPRRTRCCSGMLKLTHDPGILPLWRGPHADRHAAGDRDGVRLLELPEAGRSMGLLFAQAGAAHRAARRHLGLHLERSDYRVPHLYDVRLFHPLGSLGQVARPHGSQRPAHGSRCSRGGTGAQKRWSMSPRQATIRPRR
jgi:hypothetical protein